MLDWLAGRREGIKVVQNIAASSCLWDALLLESCKVIVLALVIGQTPVIVAKLIYTKIVVVLSYT